MKKNNASAKFAKIMGSYGMILILLLLIVCFAVSIPQGRFLSSSNIFNVLRQVSIVGIIAGGVLAPILIYILFALTWTHVAYDLKYQIYTPTANLNEVPHTVVEFDKIKRNKKKENVDQVIYRREIREAEIIAPYTEQYKSQYTDGVKRTIDFRSAPNVTNDCYFFRFAEKDGSKTVIIVEVVAKMVDRFKYSNKEATVVSEVSR